LSNEQLQEKARVEIESLNSKNRTLSNQKIVIIDFDSTDELSSEQFEMVQKCFGISKTEVTVRILIGFQNMPICLTRM
jgi:hypothetical protein